MEYKYGVEYKVNGKKPDLDDVEIEWWSKSGNSGQCNSMQLNWWIGFRDEVTKFRIVDERFKSKQSESHSKPSVHNSWYENGDLPPVGEWVEFDEYLNDKWLKVQIRGYWTENGNTSVWIQSVGKPNITKDKFRPIKSEREKFVEAAWSLVYKYANITQGESKDLAEELYDLFLTNNKDKQ